MAPTFYHYRPLSMDQCSEKGVQHHRWLVVFLVLLSVGMLVSVIVLAVKLNSTACKNGLVAEQECRNRTHLLEHQLTRAQDVLLETEAQAAACNQTVATLMASLETEKAQSRKQQELVQKLQEEIKELKQKLKTSLDQELRKENEASGGENSSTSSGNILSRCVITLLLAVSLQALLA
ncbi:bone marrow stromal antigen 2 [Molossus molossus]|uniref:bone marrow stromal antigen 2 n=1 Tax=Molossus molossus TaxID=27622 RepID=UPI0017463724|nr:bone marrow stromal antigen 2 [Molossus molossus]